MIPFSIKVPVPAEVVFPAGALFLGVDPQTDFDLRGKVADDQVRDKETGERVWIVRACDLEMPDPEAPFRAGSAELKVRVVAPYRPVPPASLVPGYPPVVTFTDLVLTPWIDQQKCTGSGTRCRARLSFSLRATGMVAFDGGA